jgi:hypothetical protein
MPAEEQRTFTKRGLIVHGVLAVLTTGLWLVVPFVIWGRRRQEARPTGTREPIRTKITLAVLAVAIPLLLASCGLVVFDSVTGSSSPDATATDGGDSRTERCSRFGDTVEGYDILLARRVASRVTSRCSTSFSGTAPRRPIGAA